jgi:hypothetical protein
MESKSNFMNVMNVDSVKNIGKAKEKCPWCITKHRTLQTWRYGRMHFNMGIMMLLDNFTLWPLYPRGKKPGSH